MRFCIKVALLATVVEIAGCGGQLESSVRGIVTLDDQPLPRGTVTFHPISGGPAAYGTVDSDGTYTLKTGTSSGLSPGEYKVTVVATEALPENLPSHQTPPVGRLLTPSKYGALNTTPLNAEIRLGSNQVDLALRSQD